MNAQLSLAERLTAEATEALRMKLSGYGNTINTNTEGGRAHAAALASVIQTYSRLAFEKPEERIAYPLATGLGKTQSAIAWIRAADRLNAGVSVLVCQEQIDSLEDFYRDLISEGGVPAEKVGLLHSNPRHATIPSIDPEDANQYPILLVTHARIKGPRDADYLNQYGDSERDLVIWDESLIKSQSRCIAASDVAQAQAAADVILSGDWGPETEENTSGLVGYLKRSLLTLRTALHSKCRDPLYMEPRDADQIERYVSMLYRVLKGNRGVSAITRETLVEFLRISQFPLRMVYLGEGDRGDGAITYLLTVPSSFKRIVILDASCGVRELCKQDAGIIMDATHELTAKRFDNLSVTQVVTAGGRSTMAHWRKNTKAITDYVAYLKTLPADEAVLTVTYKQPKLEERFHDILADAGLEPNATIQVWKRLDSGRYGAVAMPKYQFISWGQEKAVSRYAYCQHMVALGVLRRDPLELSSQIAGQHEDLSTDFAADRDFIRKVQASEQFYHLQQFIGRGRCREVSNGQAKAATVRVYDQADFGPWIEQGLPGASWDIEEPARKESVKRRPRSNTKVAEIADRIVEHVKGSGELKLSLRAIKSAVAVDVPPKTFARARELALNGLPNWSLEGYTLVNVVT